MSHGHETSQFAEPHDIKMVQAAIVRAFEMEGVIPAVEPIGRPSVLLLESIELLTSDEKRLVISRPRLPDLNDPTRIAESETDLAVVPTTFIDVIGVSGETEHSYTIEDDVLHAYDLTESNPMRLIEANTLAAQIGKPVFIREFMS